jgi:PAS domain S-box-containing protein
MTTTTHANSPPITPGVLTAAALALRLAHAENALLALTAGQVDAIIDPDGKAYLLRPAQEHLRQNEKRLQAVIDSVPDVIMVVNRGGVILSQNLAASTVLGCKPEELTGKSIFEHIAPDDFAPVYSAFFKVIEGLQENATIQFSHRTGGGAYRSIHATLAVLHDVCPASVVFSLRPVTYPSSRQMEPIRRENNDATARLARDQFLAMLAHELRTPLAPALLGVEELLQDERFVEAGPTLAMIRRNIALETRLLAELFDFTSLGQRKMRLQAQWIDVHEAIRLALETCRPEFTESGSGTLLDLRAAKAFVLADAVKLQQIMWNLLKNAIKFSPLGSPISISTFNDPFDRLAIEISDHGIGIDAELLPLIFDSFQQGDLSLHRTHDGLGLGLFIARGLAEAQGGTLTAASEGHGKGSTFCLTLPKAAANRSLSSTGA